MTYSLPENKLFIRPVDMRKRYGEHYDPNVFKRWEQAGKIIKLRNGLYRNRAFAFRGSFDRFVVAAHLYEPSYVSLISAFRHYNFIPETVYGTTSVTTRKTKQFQNDRGHFSFKTIKPELFWGFNIVPWNGSFCRLAKPEKCLLDMFYLDARYSDPDWVEEMRFDWEEIFHHLDFDLLAFYEKVFNSKAVSERVDVFLNALHL